LIRFFVLFLESPVIVKSTDRVVTPSPSKVQTVNQSTNKEEASANVDEQIEKVEDQSSKQSGDQGQSSETQANSKNSNSKTSNSTETGSSQNSGFHILNEEMITVETYDDGFQGPIVALSLGLAITLLLLILVGCRLRTVKRRLRKGRALHSNEADYLINGMYL